MKISRQFRTLTHFMATKCRVDGSDEETQVDGSDEETQDFSSRRRLKAVVTKKNKREKKL